MSGHGGGSKGLGTRLIQALALAITFGLLFVATRIAPEVEGPLDSAYTQWNTHSLPLPPVGNEPAPSDNGAHDNIRDIPQMHEQIQMFFHPDGRAVNTCGGPCDYPPQ